MRLNEMKYSIIIPVYNTESYLRKCLNSVINQTYSNIEIIIVDDGSTDGSKNIYNEYAKKDSRILTFYKENSGLSDARNLGIQYSTGDYILLLDSDDYFDLDGIELLDKSIVECQKKVDIISMFLKQIDIQQNKEIHLNHSLCNYQVVNGVDFFKNELKNDSMYMAAVLNIYSRDFLLKNKLCFKSGILHEDEEFTPRAVLSAKSILPTTLNFYNYIIRSNSITTKKDLSKNVTDLFTTLQELEQIYLQLTDEELKKLCMNNLVEKYLYMYSKAEVYKYKSKQMKNKKFVKNKANTLRNKLKVFLFLLNDHLYCYINHKI